MTCRKNCKCWIKIDCPKGDENKKGKSSQQEIKKNNYKLY